MVVPGTGGEGLKTGQRVFFSSLLPMDYMSSEERGTTSVVSSYFLALCTECNKSYERVNQENDAFTFKPINMSSTFFSVKQSYFPNVKVKSYNDLCLPKGLLTQHITTFTPFADLVF